MIKAPHSKAQFRVVCRWIGVIERAFDELTICNQIKPGRHRKELLELVADDLATWRTPGQDNSYIAWHCKEVAYHKLSLVLCGFCTYERARLDIWGALEVSLGRLIEERQALYYFLEEIKELSQ